MNTLSEARAVLAAADRLYGAAEVRAAYRRLAGDIQAGLGDTEPVILAVMFGGLVPLAEIVKRLTLPLRLGYVHATRYRERLRGAELDWRCWAVPDLAGETVLVVDDILDEGHTLAAVLDKVREHGPARLYSCVLVDKHKPAAKPVQADFVGLTVPDRYVFGCGMDYKGYWRNLPEIYAVAEGG